MACFYKIYLLPEILPCMDVSYLFGNSRAWAEEIESGILIFGVGSKILGPEWVGTLEKNCFFFLIWHFYKNRQTSPPPTIKF
jgi:hypothetical protein